MQKGIMLKLYLKRVKTAETHPSDHKQTIPSKTHNNTNSQQKHRHKHNCKTEKQKHKTSTRP